MFVSSVRGDSLAEGLSRVMIKELPRRAWRGARPKEARGKWRKPMVLEAAGALGFLILPQIIGLRKGGNLSRGLLLRQAVFHQLSPL